MMASLNISALNTVFESGFDIHSISFTDFMTTVKPLVMFVIGMSIYALFVFKFYRFLAKRDILELKTDRYYGAYEGFLHHLIRIIFYVLENLILIPLLVFFWFMVLAVLLLFLSKNQEVYTILLTSASIVGAVRITAYYNENLSQDLAKMIPFALLGVFLVDVSYFSVESTIATAKILPGYIPPMLYFLAFVTILEFVMRIVHGITSLFIMKKEIQDI